MNMPMNDPLGYYALFGVDPSASIDEIKKAFKAKAQEIHPDKNSSANATRDFQRLNEAYHVLGDPEARSNYDADAYMPEEQQSQPRSVQPIPCCVCGKISVQPRYVIYRQVVSIVYVTYRSGRQGVFCAKCAASKAYMTSGITWLFGWWGIPFGPIYSIHAIARNMLGEQPALANFRVLAKQAFYFVFQKQMDIARLLADQAMEFVPKIPGFSSNQEYSQDRDRRALLTTIRDTTPAPARALKPSWGVKSLSFRLQALSAGLVSLVLAGFLISVASHPRTAYRHVPPSEILYRSNSNEGTTEAPAADSGATASQGLVAGPTSRFGDPPVAVAVPNFQSGAGTDLHVVSSAPLPHDRVRAAEEPRDWAIVSVKPAQETTQQITNHAVDYDALAKQGGAIMSTRPFNEQALPLPTTGLMHMLRKRSGEITAPFKIVTYSGSFNYYVKLVDLNTNIPVMFLFIRSGESISTRVPLGRYELRFADGGTWYGEDERFGPPPMTSYSKADTVLIFERQGDDVEGYTLHLQKQIDGNLTETTIAASEF